MTYKRICIEKKIVVRLDKSYTRSEPLIFWILFPFKTLLLHLVIRVWFFFLNVLDFAFNRFNFCKKKCFKDSN